MCHLSNKHPKKYAEVKQKMEEEKQQRAAKRTRSADGYVKCDVEKESKAGDKQ